MNKKNLGRLENYSYTVAREGQEYFENVHLPLSMNQHVTLLNGNVRMSRGNYRAGSSGTFVMNEYRQEELILTDEMLVVWTERSKDNLRLYYRSDFEASALENILSIYIPYDPMALRYTTDAPETLWETVETYLAAPDNSRWTWKIETEFDQERQATLYVLKRFKADESRPDIIVEVDPSRDYAVTKYLVQPYGQPDNYRRTFTKKLVQINGQWIVSRYDLLESSDHLAKPLMEISVSFTDITPTPAEAAAEMSMAAMKLPSKMSVDVATPGPKGVTHIRGGRLELQSGEFVPANGPAPGAPRIIPMQNPRKGKIDEIVDWAIESLIYLVP